MEPPLDPLLSGRLLWLVFPSGIISVYTVVLVFFFYKFLYSEREYKTKQQVEVGVSVCVVEILW